MPEMQLSPFAPDAGLHRINFNITNTIDPVGRSAHTSKPMWLKSELRKNSGILSSLLTLFFEIRRALSYREARRSHGAV